MNHYPRFFALAFSALPLLACGGDDSPKPQEPSLAVVTPLTYPGISTLAADDARVYFGNEFDVQSAPRGGGAHAVLSAERVANRVIVGVARDGIVVSHPTAGGATYDFLPNAGAPTQVADAPGAEAVAADDDGVFWCAVGTMLRAPLRGGNPTTLSSAMGGRVRGVVLGAKDVFAVRAADGSKLEIVRVPKAGGDPTSVAKADAIRWPRASGQSLFWIGAAGACGSGIPVRTVAASGGEPADVASFDGCAVDFQVDDRNVYVALAGQSDAHGDAVGGSIVMVPKSGGAWSTVASDITNLHSLAVAAGAVFWAEGASTNHVYAGAIMKKKL